MTQAVFSPGEQSSDVNRLRRFVRRHPRLASIWLIIKKLGRWLNNNTIMGLFVAPGIATVIVSLVLSFTNPGGPAVTGIPAALTFSLTLLIFQSR